MSGDTGVNLVTIEDIRKVCIFSFYVASVFVFVVEKTYSFTSIVYLFVYNTFSPRTYTTRGIFAQSCKIFGR